MDRLGRRLRAAHRVCRTVVLRLRFDDFSRATRSHTLADSTADTETILGTARALLALATPMITSQGITLLGISLSNLADDTDFQLTLPIERQPEGALDASLDALRERFGSQAVTRAVLIGRDPGLSVPLLPD